MILWFSLGCSGPSTPEMRVSASARVCPDANVVVAVRGEIPGSDDVALDHTVGWLRIWDETGTPVPVLTLDDAHVEDVILILPDIGAARLRLSGTYERLTAPFGGEETLLRASLPFDVEVPRDARKFPRCP